MSTTKDQIVRLTIEDGLATVCLNNPPGNRVSLAVLARFEEVVATIEADESVRAAWLWAEGDRFSEGADLKDPELIQRIGGSEEDRRDFAEQGQRATAAWAGLRVPTVVSALGYIVGAGAGFFTVSDFRFSAPGSRLSFPEVDRGMYLSWGIIPRLVTEYGMPIARHLAMGGFSVRVEELPPMSVYLTNAESTNEEAMRFAQALTRKPAFATQMIKKTLNEVAEIADEVGKKDPERFAQSIGHPEFMEAVQKWFMKKSGA